MLSTLPLDSLTSAALGRASELGVSHAEFRIEHIRSQTVVLRDGQLETAVDDTEVGMGLRVVHRGSVGFAATAEMESSAAAELADRAVALAVAALATLAVPARLADEPPAGTAQWSSSYDIDPTDVTLADKVAHLATWSEQLLGGTGIDHVSAHVVCVVEDKFFADLGGSRLTQRRVRVHPVVEAFSVDPVSGAFESMRTLAPPAGRGWEYLTASPGAAEPARWDWASELEALPALLAAKVRAPSVDPGTYDLVIEPSNLWLTIHESIGHATELDRALGYEAAYAGTSFATFDQLGSLRYGSDVMQVTGDRTTPHGLATVAWDDEGVEAQSFDLVRDGTLVGYQLDRRMAAENGFGRSNGCAFADSPMHIPIQRMANVSLGPAPHGGPTTDELVAGVDSGILVAGDKSWSIDMQRHNFQFTGQRFFRIRHGRLEGQVKDVAYQSSTTDFWESLEAVGNRSTYVLGGAFNCGKGQPGQVAPVSHGCPSALFRRVRVLNARSESTGTS
ncbi:MAG TPA: TldD/PmbA family protein [Acidimicrobiales bacterium]|nr:TldD/PmbA family protein [Acidimicrobiales bacterium]